MVGEADAVCPRLIVHGAEIDGAELVHARLHRTGAVKALPLLAGEPPVGNVHAHDRGQVASGAAAQGADAVRVNGILRRVSPQEPERLPAVQHGSREDGLPAEAVLYRGDGKAVLQPLEVGLHMVVPLVSHAETAAVEVDHQGEGTLPLLRQVQVQPLGRGPAGIGDVQIFPLHPADIRHPDPEAGGRIKLQGAVQLRKIFRSKSLVLCHSENLHYKSRGGRAYRPAAPVCKATNRYF